MLRALLGLLGRLALVAATAAFLSAVSLMLLGAWLLTWPMLRKSPRDRRLRAAADLATAGFALLSTFQSPRQAIIEAHERVQHDND